MKSKLAAALATWFGCGHVPLAPGTAGSIAALGLAWLLTEFAGWKPIYFAALAMATLPPAIWAAGVTARERGASDPGIVVVDEVVGQWITLTGVASFSWKAWLGALVLFRVFDIWKPAPIHKLESLPGGTGIVADDVMAGIYGALVLFLAGCFNLY